MLRKVSPIALLLVCAAGLQGCGGGGGGDAPAPTPPPPAPTPAPPPPPPPPPGPAPIPPLSQPPIDISGDGHTVGTAFWPPGSDANGGKGETIDNVPCSPTDGQAFHIHTHVSIVLDGQLLTMPGPVGILAATPQRAACVYEIHTHDGSGRLHIESATPVSSKLGTYFKIWGQPLTTDNVAGITGKPIVYYITDNGVTSVYTGDPAQIDLISHREITIQIGTPITTIPNFTWTGG